MINNIDELLKAIDPASLSYSEWLNVGMALKHEGFSAQLWDEWSKRDTARYHTGECARKWNGFQGSASPVTGGTIVELAKRYGYVCSTGHELDWNDTITGELTVTDKNWIENKELPIPEKWDPAEQLIAYIGALFNDSDKVGYVTKCTEYDGRLTPSQGVWDRTAKQLKDLLRQCDGDIGQVVGDYNKEVGAWIRFNPFDGKGIKDINVTDYRYALIESDKSEIEKQYALLCEMELPIAALVHSGNKSLHAIVHIDAATFDEYKKRVNFLYEVCKKNGLDVDTQNRNPSRLSRMPGIIRGNKKQYLIATHIGKSSFEEWKEWIESVTDDLPDPENLSKLFDDLPPLAPALIDGVLRQGHKLLLAGPSKAGKSYALIELCIAIAEGTSWLGFGCTQGKVMYVNLELDRASCLHRFKDVYEANGTRPLSLDNIDIWNLRGKAIPMDKLAPKLIHRALKKHYIAVIIDPIYKIITGDENSAEQMARFCNQFDKVCNELGCAVIYCHHHSKGVQNTKKSMDRASGSGVFARDPDAILDLIELELADSVYEQLKNNAVCKVCAKWLSKYIPDYKTKVSEDDMLNYRDALAQCRRLLESSVYASMLHDVANAKNKADTLSGWRVEGTLREFPKFAPLDVWFDYPIHKIDYSGMLKDAAAGSEDPPWKKALNNRKPKEQKADERKNAIEQAYSYCNIDGKVTVQDLAEYMGTSEKTVRRKIKEHGKYKIEDNNVTEI